MSYSPKQKAVLRAVQCGTLVKVKQLFDPDYLTKSNGDEFGFTLVMTAIKRKHKTMVCFLVENKCRVTKPNEEMIIHDTPLHWAVRMGYNDIISKLLKNGASVHEKGLDQKTVIYEAWKKNEHCIVNKLLESIDFHHSSPNNPDDLLHFRIACKTSCEKAIEQFVQVGFPVDIYLDMSDENEKGYRPLHYAVAGKHTSIVALLLGKSADVNLQSERGVTPLHLACQYEKIDIIQLLVLNNADPNIKDNKGWTAFHLAFFYKRFYAISLLQSRISKTINHTNFYGLSHFHILCTTNFHTTILSLLQSGTATIDMCVDDDGEMFSGYSALHFAAEFNREHTVKLLLQHNADVKYYPDFTKITPLHVACLHSDFKYHDLNDPEKVESIQQKIEENDWTLSKQSQINIIKMLLAHNCNVNARDNLGKSSLMYACEIHSDKLKLLNTVLSKKKIYNTAIRQLWLMQKEIIKLLILNNADIHIHTLAKESILHLIIKSYHASLELCEFFIKKGLKVHSLDNGGSSLLHSAVDMLHESIVELLLRYNVDVNIRNHESLTCLHIRACDYFPTISSRLIMKRLLQYNADVELLNSNKQTPLDVAFSSGNSFAFSLLLRYGADVNNMDFLLYISKLNDMYSFYPILESTTDLLATHVKKLDMIHFHVNRFVKAYLKNVSKCFRSPSIEEITESDALSLQCLKELERMKSIKINSYTTLFNVLYKDKNSMVPYVGNENLKTILTSKSFDKDFPQLGFSLKLQFRRGLARKDLLKYSRDSLDSLIGFHLPETVFDKISCYLLDAELDSLNKVGSEKCQKVEQKRKRKPSAKRRRL